MIIINCANCAAPLPHDNTGCVRYLFEESPAACARCQTRYCDATCRRAHWDGGGHRDVCSEIARAGGAEQHHADQKYAEATAAAIEAHAEASARAVVTLARALQQQGGAESASLRVAEQVWKPRDTFPTCLTACPPTSYLSSD